ncbi:hypothetical protein lerEdw1_008476 [Lerista edwardsae]|nr:hypothetical protein lerEdw1_008476 [Lerista edwardsae]
MIRRAEGRSTALARAQAQLAGSRVAARGAQEHSGNRPVGLALRNSSDSCLSVHLASDLSNLSGTSTQTRRKEVEGERLMETLMSSRPPGRFLKQKPQETKDGGTAGLHPAAKTNLSTASKGRSGAVLRKLAQIESKIKSRKVRLDTSEINQSLSEEELFWSKSSQDPVQVVEIRGGGVRSRKGETGLKENMTPVSGRFHVQDRNVHLGDKAGLDNFRVNVLSLDDLAPSMVSQEEEPKIKAKTVQAAAESSNEQATALLSVATPSPFKAPKAPMDKTATVEEDEEVEDLGETEISEQLNGSSAELSSRKPESSISAEYSDDFEPSVSEEMEREYSSEESQGSSNSSVHSRPSNLSSVSFPPAGTRSTKPLRITVKEAAVQTRGSSLTYHWLQTEAAATLSQTAGGSAVEAPPIASHVVSMDTLEALTTYSPAVFALNDLLKQNVLLIQQFVEFSRHLHTSVLASLEDEKFHYHTLEEAKAAWLLLKTGLPLTAMEKSNPQQKTDHK